MKVFINKRTGGWSGGLAVVAANNAEEAHRVYCFNDPLTYYYNQEGDACRQEDSISFSNYYYSPEGWQEVPCLTADVTEPTLIAEDGYTE